MAANNSSSSSVTAEDNTDDATSTIVGAIIAVALRLYTQLSLKQGLKWDDWFILISLASLVVAGILVLVGTYMNPALSTPFSRCLRRLPTYVRSRVRFRISLLNDGTLNTFTAPGLSMYLMSRRQPWEAY